MARIIGGIAASHTPTIGFAYDRNKRDDPVWAPIFENFAPLSAWLAEKRPDVLLWIYNDHVTSFYSWSPSGFMVEYGWGGRLVEPGKWTPEEYTVGPSLWGHDRVWLPEKDREVAREMRMNAAREGKRAPVQVMEGNYKLMSGTCAWWDRVRDS